MVERNLLVLGAGGHAKVVADAAMSMGYRVIAFLDADPKRAGCQLLGLPVFVADERQAIARCKEHSAQVVVAVGANRARKRVFELFRAAGVPVATIIHARAVVSSSACVGAGTVVFAGAVVNSDAHVGRNVILNTSVSVDHDNLIEDHAHLSPGVRTGGTVFVGEGTHIGVGASVRNNTRIGAWSVIGMGSAVVRDVPDGVVAFGVPARVIRPNAESAVDGTDPGQLA